MSVKKRDRETSKAQFIETARKLEIFALRFCVSQIPKRYSFYIGQPLVKLAVDIHTHTIEANSLYPTNRHEAQIRRDRFNDVKAELHALISQVGVLLEMFDNVNKSKVEEWMKMIKYEIDLIKGVMNSDKERAKKLPE